MHEEQPTQLTVVERPRGEIAHVERKPLVFTDEQRAMIRDTFASGCNDSEFYVLMAICQAKRLNPLLGQVHLVKRWTQDRGDVWALQTGIDGFRSIAEDTGLYDGQDDVEFGYDEKTGALVWAKARVYRKDIARPFVGTAHFAEYVQTKSEKKGGGPTKMWAEKPHIMLAKCAEALAFRKAFPQPLGELYTSDEFRDEASREDASTSAGRVAGLPQTAEAHKIVDELTKALAAARPLGGAALDDVAKRIKDEVPSGPARDSLREMYKKLKAECREEQHKGGEKAGAPAPQPEGAAAKPEPKTERPPCEVCGLSGAHAKDCPDRDDAGQEQPEEGARE